VSRLFLAVFIVSAAGCISQSVTHDPDRAATDANQFLKAIYIDRNSSAALALAENGLRESVARETLTNMVDELIRERGALKRMAAESYLMADGRNIVIFYVDPQLSKIRI